MAQNSKGSQLFDGDVIDLTEETNAQEDRRPVALQEALTPQQAKSILFNLITKSKSEPEVANGSNMMSFVNYNYTGHVTGKEQHKLLEARILQQYIGGLNNKNVVLLVNPLIKGNEADTFKEPNKKLTNNSQGKILVLNNEVVISSLSKKVAAPSREKHTTGASEALRQNMTNEVALDDDVIVLCDQSQGNLDLAAGPSRSGAVASQLLDTTVSHRESSKSKQNISEGEIAQKGAPEPQWQLYTPNSIIHVNRNDDMPQGDSGQSSGSSKLPRLAPLILRKTPIQVKAMVRQAVSRVASTRERPIFAEDVEIEPACVVTPVDIAKIIRQGKPQVLEGRCEVSYPESSGPFRGFTRQEQRKRPACGVLRALFRDEGKMLRKMRKQMRERFESNFVHCGGSPHDFLPEIVKIEHDENDVIVVEDDVKVVKIEHEENEAVVVEDDTETELQTIAQVISKVNQEVRQLAHHKDEATLSKPQAALKLIQAGLELIKSWSEEAKKEVVVKKKRKSKLKGKEKVRKGRKKEDGGKKEDGEQVGQNFTKKSRPKRMKLAQSEQTPRKRDKPKKIKLNDNNVVTGRTEPKKKGKAKKADNDNKKKLFVVVKRIEKQAEAKKKGRRKKKVPLDDKDNELLVVKKTEVQAETKRKGGRPKKVRSDNDDKGSELLAAKRAEMMENKKRGRPKKVKPNNDNIEEVSVAEPKKLWRKKLKLADNHDADIDPLLVKEVAVMKKQGRPRKVALQADDDNEFFVVKRVEVIGQALKKKGRPKKVKLNNAKGSELSIVKEVLAQHTESGKTGTPNNNHGYNDIVLLGRDEVMVGAEPKTAEFYDDDDDDNVLYADEVEEMDPKTIELYEEDDSELLVVQKVEMLGLSNTELNEFSDGRRMDNFS